RRFAFTALAPPPSETLPPSSLWARPEGTAPDPRGDRQSSCCDRQTQAADEPTRGPPLTGRGSRTRPPWGRFVDRASVALAATGPPTPSLPHICRRADVREPG